MGSLARRMRSNIRANEDEISRQRYVRIAGEELKGNEWSGGFEAVGNTRKKYRFVVKHCGKHIAHVQCTDDFQLFRLQLERIRSLVG